MPRPLDPGGSPESPLDLEALAAKELHRARRYGRSFSLVVLGLDVGALARELDPDGAQAAARGFASALSRIVRDADTLARASGGEHHLLLPETELFGAQVLVRRAWDEIRREPAMFAERGRALRRVSIGAATFPGDGEDHESLLDACRRRQGEWRSSMLFLAAPEGLCADSPFWQLADALVGGEPIPAGSPSARLPLDPELLESVEVEAAREIARNLRARGVVYVAGPGGGDRISAELPQLEGSARQGDAGSRVYVLGTRAPGPGRNVREHPLVARVAVDGDRHLAERSLFVLLSESASYALLQAADGRIFHSSDAPLVDALAAKLESRFRLQAPPEPGAARVRIERLLRSDGAPAAAHGSGLQGSLAQMPLVDLLQILAVNRKTGRLEVARRGSRGEIALVEGQVVDAAAGTARGEKALFRLLSWREGRFAFASGGAAGERRIEKRLEELLLEGVRQSDEAARLLPMLPAEHERVRLSAGAAALAGMPPVVAEVAALLARPCTVAEVLDGASACDLDVLRALATLLEAGHARREPGPGATARERALLAPRELSALRRRMARAARGNPSAIGKVIVAGGGPLARRSALVRIGALPGFDARADGTPVAFGTLGRLVVGEGASVDLVALPSDPAMAPLWRPFAAGAVAALVLTPAEQIAPRLAELAAELRMPLGACGPSDASVEPVLRSAPAGCGYLGADPAEALRALLALAGTAQ